jgi:phage-related baseplate assembly protein
MALSETARAPGIDLSLLPPPDVIEALDFETLLATRKARLLELTPADRREELAATLALETEPVTILLEEMAYSELLLRSRINDAARQCFLASARGANLRHIAALYGVEQLVVDPGDPKAIPPIPPTMETDDRLRLRTQLAIDGMSTAGPGAAYRYHALSAHGEVEDAEAISPVPGQVVVPILSRSYDGGPTQEVLDAVIARLNSENIRPLTDEVIVQPAELIPFTVEAVITVYPGPSPAPVIAAAQAAIKATLSSLHRIGYDIARSALLAALHKPGVQHVNLISPADDIEITETQCGRCDLINLSLAGEARV